MDRLGGFGSGRPDAAGNCWSLVGAFQESSSGCGCCDDETCEAAGFRGGDVSEADCECKKEVTQDKVGLLGWVDLVDYVLDDRKGLGSGILKSVEPGCKEIINRYEPEVSKGFSREG